VRAPLQPRLAGAETLPTPRLGIHALRSRARTASKDPDCEFFVEKPESARLREETCMKIVATRWPASRALVHSKDPDCESLRETWILTPGVGGPFASTRRHDCEFLGRSSSPRARSVARSVPKRSRPVRILTATLQRKPGSLRGVLAGPSRARAASKDPDCEFFRRSLRPRARDAWTGRFPSARASKDPDCNPSAETGDPRLGRPFASTSCSKPLLGRRRCRGGEALRVYSALATTSGLARRRSTGSDGAGPSRRVPSSL